MKTQFFHIVILFFFLHSSSQLFSQSSDMMSGGEITCNPDRLFDWLVWGGSAGFYDYSRGIAVDGEENVYFIGTFYGSGHLDTLDVVPGGVITKHTRYGWMKWGKSLSGYQVNHIAPDNKNNALYAVGQLASQFYVTKYSLTGELRWFATVPWEGRGHDEARCVSVDNAGNAYVGGSINSLPYLCKYAPNGATVWQRNFESGNGVGEVLSSTFDNRGKLYVVLGQYGYHDQNFRLIKIDSSSGMVLWIKETTSQIAVSQIVYDGRGHILVAGSFFNQLNFDQSGDGPFTVALSSFLARYDTSGAFLDVVPLMASGRSAWIQANGLAVDQEGNTFLIGTAEGTLKAADRDFPSLHQEAFVMKFDRDLRLTGFARANALSDGFGIAAGLSGIYVTGRFYGHGATFGGVSTPGSDNGEIFIAKLMPNITLSVGETEVEKNTLRLWPNRSAHSTRLQVPVDTRVEQILIHDVAGRLVRSFEEDLSGRTTIDLSLDGLPSGMYYVSVRGNGVSSVMPLVKTSGE